MFFWKKKKEESMDDPVLDIPKKEEKAMNETKHMADERISYHCGKCNYKFKRKKEQKVNICPYCGSEGDIETEKGSQQYLDDVREV